MALHCRHISDDFRSGRPRNSGDRALSTFAASRYTVPEKREELKFAVRSAVAKFGVDFYKYVYSDWVKRHMQCAACGGSYFEKECKT